MAIRCGISHLEKWNMRILLVLHTLLVAKSSDYRIANLESALPWMFENEIQVRHTIESLAESSAFQTPSFAMPLTKTRSSGRELMIRAARATRRILAVPHHTPGPRVLPSITCGPSLQNPVIHKQENETHAVNHNKRSKDSDAKKE